MDSSAWRGNKIVDQNGNPIALRGMSLFWSQWIGKYYNYDCIQWLHENWNASDYLSGVFLSIAYRQFPANQENAIGEITKTVNNMFYMPPLRGSESKNNCFL